MKTFGWPRPNSLCVSIISGFHRSIIHCQGYSFRTKKYFGQKSIETYRKIDSNALCTEHLTLLLPSGYSETIVCMKNWRHYKQMSLAIRSYVLCFIVRVQMEYT